MKPVELHIIMRDQTKEGMNEITSGLAGVNKATDAVSANFKARMIERSAIIKQVEGDIKSLRKQWEDATPGKMRNDLAQDLVTANKALLEEKRILEELKVQAKDTGAACASMSGQMKQNSNVAALQQMRFNGLNMSMQQVARELPSLAMGPQMFFLAISNNLPILADNIKMARLEYDALKASGQKATPVWKQMVSSLFSWQTVLVAGITLLVVYGKEIGNWVKELFTGKKALSDTYTTLKEFQQAVAETSKKSISEFEKLSQSWNRLGDNLKAKEKFILDNKEAFRGLGVAIENVNDAENIFNNNKDAFIESLIARAKSVAAFDLAAKEFQKGIEQDTKADAMPDKKKWSYFQKQTFGGNPEKIEARKKAEEYYVSGRALIQKQLHYEEEERQKLTESNIKTVNTIVEGSIAAIEAAIAAKQEALKKVTNRKDYARIEAEIKAEQEKLKAITGSKDRAQGSNNNKDLTTEILRSQHERENIRIAAIKDEGERVRKQIEVEYGRQIAEVKRQEAEWKKARSGVLKEDQQKWVDEKTGLAEDTRADALWKVEEETLKAQLESMREYLKEYGTFQQRKLTIAEEYAEKIRQAESQGNPAEVTRLRNQRQSAIAGVETAAIKAEIDWQVVFGEFGGMFSDAIKTTLDKAEIYTRTDEFRNADQSSQNDLIDAINQMKKSLGGTGSLNFKKLGQDVRTYQMALHSLQLATDNETNAHAKLKKAREAYAKALKDGTVLERETAQTTRDEARRNADFASEAVKQQTNATNEAQQNVTDTATNLRISMEDVVEGLSKLSSGSLSGAFNGVIQAGSALSSSFKNLVENAKSVPVIGWILSIIDIFKDGLSLLVGSLLDTIFNAISGIIGDVLSGDLFVTIGKSLKDGIGKIFDAISFGGWDSLMRSINGSNAKEVNDIIDQLTTSNKYLVTAIERLTAEMSKSGGAKATEYYESTLEKQRQKVENDRQMLEAKMGYHGAHHSNNYYINEAFNADDWKVASDYVGKTLRSAGDLWKLSPEDLAKLQELPDIWDKINAGKYDQSDWLDEYITDAGTLLELTAQWQDAITDTSFDNIKSEMKSLLADFKVDSKAAIASVDEFMKNAILSSIVSGTYSELIKEWQSQFADAMKDGILTTTEADFLRNRYQGIVDQMTADRDAAFDAAGIKGTDEYSQSGRPGTFTAMSQDTGNELKGLFTSVQMHVSNMDDSLANVAGLLYQAMDAIGELIDNTSYCKYLEQINERLERMERDGLKMT